ncbi:acyl-[acyl-carrier-protein] thioesterase [Liquorilactobacillus oeni]|uniref:Acyl-acyl carrier protein thioesterase n=1 Tax=Liquorilactobacillus oeni DSM 19972 TaxID=1423777 RepID=A0A0R1MK22_9LACO|nr:acyl-ACP thioesterase domain-containing protein [Liquorilactobacillus oeni]KRL04859.1 acyl-acyl carrier protein thioesterase [Liquorilactobacillus oeni DSM 19972]
MAERIFSEKHQVLFYETDRTRKTTVGMLVNILMLASQDQSIALGLTEEKVNALGYGWVITQHIIDIQRMPKYEEKIRVFTKADSYNRYFCYRDFWIEDEQEKKIVQMHSVFVLMDQKKRKIARVLKNLIEPYDCEYSTKVERTPNPKKLTTARRLPAKHYRVRFMDIDSNQHVNNVHYFDWMIDGLSEGFLLQHQLRRMNIKYKQEIHYGETVESNTEIDDKKLETFHVIKTASGESCRAHCLWEKNNF